MIPWVNDIFSLKLAKATHVDVVVVGTVVVVALIRIKLKLKFWWFMDWWTNFVPRCCCWSGCCCLGGCCCCFGGCWRCNFPCCACSQGGISRCIWQIFFSRSLWKWKSLLISRRKCFEASSLIFVRMYRWMSNHFQLHKNHSQNYLLRMSFDTWKSPHHCSSPVILRKSGGLFCNSEKPNGNKDLRWSQYLSTSLYLGPPLSWRRKQTLRKEQK